MSRRDARSNRLRRRSTRTVPAVLVGLVLLGLGVGLVWIAVLRLLDGSWPTFLSPVSTWAAALTWGSTVAIALSIGVLGVGLILLIAAWKPGRPSAMILQSGDRSDQVGSTDFVMTRRAVAKLATAYADQVDGVDSVSATVGAHRVRLAVMSASEQRSELQNIVTDRVRGALKSAGLQPMPTVTTTVRTQQL